MNTQEMLIRAIALLQKCNIPIRDAAYAAQAIELIELAVKNSAQAKE